MLENLVELVNDNLGPITKRDIGSYKVMKKGVMKFSTNCYEVQGFGRLSHLKMSAMFGLMKMESIVLTPLNVDMPFINVDIVKAMGNITLIIEMYDVNINEVVFKDEFNVIKDKYNNIPSYVPNEVWSDEIKYKESIYKKGKGILKDSLLLVSDYISTYIELANNERRVNKELKANKVDEYVTNLLKNGGVSTDQFKKLFGNDVTEYYYRHYFFGSIL